MTTKHGKQLALGPAFEEVLGARIVALALDTDRLGTFSGEIERVGTPVECARRKCEWGLEVGGGELGVASEGSFGPHPVVPFLGSGEEVLYFIDRKRDFQLHVRHSGLETNFRSATVDRLAELHAFAETAGFPGHALILRAAGPVAAGVLHKGLRTVKALEAAFAASREASAAGSVHVETDMRAHRNPTRMETIRALAGELARRLATPCPACAAPGWGRVGVERGLACAWCGAETGRVRREVLGCAKCAHRERRAPAHGLEKADPGDCPRCNP